MQSLVVAAWPSRRSPGVAAGSGLNGGAGDVGAGGGGGRTIDTVLVPGLSGVAGGGRSGVEGRGTLWTAAQLSRSGSKRGLRGLCSCRESARGRRTSSTRTLGEEAAVPVGRARKDYFPCIHLAPSRRRHLRELPRRRPCRGLGLGPGRCCRPGRGSWCWIPRLPRGGLRAEVTAARGLAPARRAGGWVAVLPD
jgi:hypothetical protein